MKFTPLNIKTQQFNKSMRGYDTEEVHAFLEKLADDYETVISENESLKKDLDKAGLKLNEFRKIEKNLQETLLKAHESSSKAVDSARKQTALMIKEAELKATQIIEKAKEEADGIRNAVLTLREEKNLIIAKLKALITTQAGLLEIKLESIEREKPQLKKSFDSEKPQPKKDSPDINVDSIIDKLL